MGRHSVAADEDDDDRAGTAGVQVVEAPDRAGRHASPEEDGEPAPVAPATTAPPRPQPAAASASAARFEAAPTTPIPRVAAEETSWSTAPIPAVEAPPAEPAPEPGPTARDLALFREHPDVRNRAIAGVLAPFVVYAVVMVVIGRTGVFLIWIWIPLIVAGVLMGLILDLGHKRYGAANRSEDRP